MSPYFRVYPINAKYFAPPLISCSDIPLNKGFLSPFANLEDRSSTYGLETVRTVKISFT